ncbi:unnamed protein product [Linum trigynum]|uniref:Uncharacterized protein n=1 Tax=Linum trigynum TaxID=586398 RepID=A0AAV2CX03_9ROSI
MSLSSARRGLRDSEGIFVRNGNKNVARSLREPCLKTANCRNNFKAKSSNGVVFRRLATDRAAVDSQQLNNHSHIPRGGGAPPCVATSNL